MGCMPNSPAKTKPTNGMDVRVIKQTFKFKTMKQWEFDETGIY
jgi:hypothetical protein